MTNYIGTYPTAKRIRIARIHVLEAIITGDGDEAYKWSRELARLSEAYLWHNASRVMPRY